MQRRRTDPSGAACPDGKVELIQIETQGSRMPYQAARHQEAYKPASGWATSLRA